MDDQRSPAVVIDTTRPPDGSAMRSLNVPVGGRPGVGRRHAAGDLGRDDDEARHDQQAHHDYQHFTTAVQS